MNKFEIKSQSFKVAALLAIVGGFLDSYSYIIRNGVFANAQTGNMVLFGINLLNRNYQSAFHFLLPIISFFLGIIIAEYWNYKQEKKQLHWRNYTLATQIIILTIVAFLPLSQSSLANVLISLNCAIQVQSFKHFHNLAYASTMCTGNLMKSAKLIADYHFKKDKNNLIKAIKYLSLIIVFIIGAAIAVVVTKLFSYHSVLFCNLLLVIIVIIINGK